jgi:hypothetical protein
VLNFSKPADAPAHIPEPAGQPRTAWRAVQLPAAPVGLVTAPAAASGAQPRTLIQAQGRADEPLAETPEYLTELNLPLRERVFRLDTEQELYERIRQSNKKTQPTTSFPEEVPLSKEPYVPRNFPALAEAVEPNYLCYQKLLFEDLNSERYGWDLGYIGPFVSAGIAVKDMLLFPMHAGTDMFRVHESNAGYCLPGDPVPYLIYPPEVSLTGAILEAGVVVTLIAIFP